MNREILLQTPSKLQHTVPYMSLLIKKYKEDLRLVALVEKQTLDDTLCCPSLCTFQWNACDPQLQILFCLFINENI